MKHLTSIANLSKADAIDILDRAEQMDVVRTNKTKLATLAGKTVANLFFEDSTRTRISFELAAKKLSAETINFASKGSSTSKGESLRDTVLTLEAMGVDAMVIRHQHSGAADYIANSSWSKVKVINAGDGTHQHPTQALLDSFTIRKHFAEKRVGTDLSGLRVLIVGDVLHSRVAKSNTELLNLLGAEVAFCAPRTLAPESISLSPNQTYNDLDLALENEFDVVMMLRLQLERMNSAFFPSQQEYSSLFQLNASRSKRLSKHTVVMHPGPMNRGLEIAESVADDDNSLILDQVSNGISVRMAVLDLLLANEGNS
jgi:aspartate carbamoyltransferase catalytic subunit